MKINYKVSMFFLLLLAVMISSDSVFAQGQRNDTLYFCEQYKESTEIGNSDVFYFPEGGGLVTVMLRTLKPIGVTEVFILLEKDVAGVKEKISKEPFDVEAGWDYIFFADVVFPLHGKYKVSAVKKNGDMIASGYVMIRKGENNGLIK
jgi:hypothetical protein